MPWPKKKIMLTFVKFIDKDGEEIAYKKNIDVFLNEKITFHNITYKIIDIDHKIDQGLSLVTCI